MTRVLVTGGAGFIGRHVCAELAAAGHSVLALDALHPAAHGARPAQRADGRRRAADGRLPPPGPDLHSSLLGSLGGGAVHHPAVARPRSPEVDQTPASTPNRTSRHLAGTAGGVDTGVEPGAPDRGTWHPAGAVGGVDTGVELRTGDVRDSAALREALRGVDAVVHLAAMVGMGVGVDDLPEYVSCNDLGTAVLLAELTRAGVGQLVLASSMVVYGEGAYECPTHGPVRPRPRTAGDLSAGRFDPGCSRCGSPLGWRTVDEEAPLEPRSGYAATKVAQEHLAGVWARQCGGAVIALRYHNVYGPGMPRDTPYSGVAAIFRSALAAGLPPRVFEDGGQCRDFVHVGDVARANAAALAATAEPGILRHGGFRAYNVASGRQATIGEMAAALAAACDGPEPVVTGEFRAGDVRHVVASPERAATELGFRARVDLAAGMAEFAHAPLRG